MQFLKNVCLTIFSVLFLLLAIKFEFVRNVYIAYAWINALGVCLLFVILIIKLVDSYKLTLHPIIIEVKLVQQHTKLAWVVSICMVFWLIGLGWWITAFIKTVGLIFTAFTFIAAKEIINLELEGTKYHDKRNL